MAEADVRKCDWYGFSAFIVHRYCIWLSSCSCRQHQVSGHMYLAALPTKPNRCDAGLKDHSDTLLRCTAQSSIWFMSAEMQRGPQKTKRNMGRLDTLCDFTE